MRTINNLVFKGGGVLGIAYAGAIEALSEKNLLPAIKGVAGTSAGSITAALLALEYTSAELTQIVQSTNFKDFEDHWDPLRLATKYGLYKGDALFQWIQEHIGNKTGNAGITYAQMAASGKYRELKVFSSDLNTGQIQEFSAQETPSAIVAESIRASMSIPLFFGAWQFSNEVPNNHIFVDGGMLYNFPLTAFSDLQTTLGFFLTSNVKQAVHLGYNQPLVYVKQLLTTILNAQNEDFERNPTEEAVTVSIDSLGISAVDFGLTQAQQTALFNSGKNATLTYLAN